VLFGVSETVRRTGDQLFRSPMSICVSTLIDLKPVTIGSREAGTIPVARGHESGNGALVTIWPLYQVGDIKVS
jgi:hypothetical protein